MRKLSYLACLLLVISAMTFMGKKANAAEVSVSGSASYSSSYFWRGAVIDAGDGVFWPGVGVDVGDLSFSLAAGVDAIMISGENSDVKDGAKSLTEIDLGASYGLTVGPLSAGFGVMYIGYPFYDEVDSEADDCSFIESSLSLSYDTILSPTLDVYYDYYLDDPASENPTSEDYYVKFSIGHDLISTEDGFTFSAGASLGYLNSPYWDQKGLSDFVLSLGIAKDYEKVSFSGGFYYGRAMSDDFETETGKVNYFWSDFGVSYAFN
ncbi:MAG: hypothetical protein JW864_03135 [Spirochaetes bacterium]|nr:hypothetical protein [Spirochaetota bacterium]